MIRTLQQISLILLCLLFCFINSAAGQRSNVEARVSSDERYVLAPGYGEVLVRPKSLELVFAVESIADTSSEAQLGSQASLGRLLAALKGSGIKNDTFFSHIMPLERRTVPTVKKGKVDKYIVRRTVDVTLHQPERLNELTDLGLKSGAKDFQIRRYVLGNVKRERQIAHDRAVSSALSEALKVVRKKQLAMKNPRVISDRSGRVLVKKARVGDRIKLAAAEGSSVILDGSAESLAKASKLAKHKKPALVAVFAEVYLGADIIK